tara:strand:+ start:580 stop:951 length:372 start_codon:yes stop_codon:yes gene_type:complete
MDDLDVAKVGCPLDVMHNALDDAKLTSMLTSTLIRERSGKEYDSLWDTYESAVTLLCEHYTTSMSLTQLLKSIITNSDTETLENGIECYVMTTIDVQIIFKLMTTMHICEDELLLHNISFGLH